jgi:hypothetical protein
VAILVDDTPTKSRCPCQPDTPHHPSLITTADSSTQTITYRSRTGTLDFAYRPGEAPTSHRSGVCRSHVIFGEDLDAAAASTDELYTAMDWLAERQNGIEKKLAARHLDAEANPSRMALFDLSSSWMEGSHCPLAARGYSRDGKKGKLQIEYGLLTDPAGRPVAVRVFPGNTADPAAFTQIVTHIRDTFGLHKLVMVGDRGMITARAHRCAAPASGQHPGVDHRPTRPRDQETGHRRGAAADPVRRAGPGRDHPPGLPERAAGRLPQPVPGHRTRP